MVKKIAEKFNRLSRVHERYRRQTDRRQTDGIAIAISKRNVIRSRLLIKEMLPAEFLRLAISAEFLRLLVGL